MKKRKIHVASDILLLMTLSLIKAGWHNITTAVCGLHPTTQTPPADTLNPEIMRMTTPRPAKRTPVTMGNPRRKNIKHTAPRKAIMCHFFGHFDVKSNSSMNAVITVSIMENCKDKRNAVR